MPATDVATSDRFADSSPVERLPCASEAKVIIVLVDGHCFTLDAEWSVESWTLSLRVVPGIAEAIIFDREEVANMAWVGHVVHLSMGLSEGVPVATSSPARTHVRLWGEIGSFVDGEAMLGGRWRHLLHVPSDLNGLELISLVEPEGAPRVSGRIVAIPHHATIGSSWTPNRFRSNDRSCSRGVRRSFFGKNVVSEKSGRKASF